MRECLQYFAVQGIRESGEITQLVKTHSIETPWATKDCGDFPCATAFSGIIEARRRDLCLKLTFQK